MVDMVLLSDAVADPLAVCDRVTDVVTEGEDATERVADGQPNPLVHVGLEEKDVPNDFVVVGVVV